MKKSAIKISRKATQALKTVLDSRGTLLVYMVVVILIFGVLGVSLVSLFQTSTESSATPNDAKRARYIAESGIRYALSEIRNSDNVANAAESLNTTADFKLGKEGRFTASAFSTAFKSAQNKTIFSSGDLTLDVPYSGKFPEDFNIDQAVNDFYIVDWREFKGTTPPADSYALVTASPDPGGATDVNLNVGDNYDAGLGETICFALLVTDAQTNIGRGSSIYVNEKAAEFFPTQNGAIRIFTPNNGDQYDYFYETREPPSSGKVELTNLREMPGDTWTNIADLRAGEYVILSPYNFRVFASGTSDQTTVSVGQDKPFWALAVPDEFTIYMDDLLQDQSVKQVGDVIRTQAAGDQKIELGKGTSGTEGFGDLWYGGEKAIGGDASYCDLGRCLFDKGIRVFFTTDIIPGAAGGQGFTFAMIAGGSLLVPINTSLSAGGDFKLPELLGYGGNSQINDTPLYLDGSGDGLIPPKLAVEFDTATDFDAAFNTSLAYCSGIDPVPASRNDPKPENQLRDVVQYVFWGNDDPTTFDLACRVTPESYDDNRHDAEGDEVAVNFTFAVGAPIRSEPTYDPTDQTLYFTSNYNGTADVWAIDTNDGSLKWSYNAANRNVTSKPALDTVSSERFVYFSATDDLYKLEAATGVPGTNGWLRNVATFEDKVSPVVDPVSHKIYIGSRGTERFYAYDADGTRLWDTDLGEDIEATAAIDTSGGAGDGNVYVGTGDDNSGASEEGRVFGFDRNAPAPNPPPLWPYFKTDQDVTSRPVLKDDGSVLYAVTDVGNLYAIDTALGTQVWRNLTDISAVNLIDLAVSPVDGTIYVATDNGELHSMNPANGNENWQKSLTGSITFSSPAVGPDGTVYIGTDGNRVYAVNPDSSDKWIFNPAGLGDVRSTPEVGADRVVYVGSDDGNLYALATVAVPRNLRNTYVGGSLAHLTSANLDTNVVVDDNNDWLDGSPLTRGPWAVRTEITRDGSINANGNHEYTLRTWIRQCVNSDCSDLKGTPFQDTTAEYQILNPAIAPDLPFTQVIELPPAAHDDFDRFVFGFTTAAGSADTQVAEIRDFQLTFIQTADPVTTSDPPWAP